MKLKIKILAFVLISGLTAGLLPAGISMASTGVIYVSPSSSVVEVGHEFTIGIRINPGTAVDSVQTTLSYSTADLQFISSTPSAFPLCTENSGGGGSVELACAILGGGSVSSDSLVSSVTFKALAGSGSAGLTLASPGTGNSDSNAARNGSWTNPSVSSGSVRFTSPSSSSGGSSSGGSSGGSSSSGSSLPGSSSSGSSKPTPAAKPVTISAGSPNITFDSATLNVTTNVSARVYAAYGTNSKSLNSNTAKSAAGTKTTLELNNLSPATTYYYQIAATGSQNQTTKTPVRSFTTTGYTVKVTVLDSKYQPLANHQVTLHSTPMTATTDANGVATFYNVAPGEHHLDYQVGSQSFSQVVYVSSDSSNAGSGQSAPVQTAAVVLSNYSPKSTSEVTTSKNSSHSATVIWVIVIAVLVYMATWGIFFRRQLKNKLADVGLGSKHQFVTPHFGGAIHQPTDKK